MTIALYGPTGAGKSTLAQAIQRLGEYHIISTGEFVRKNFPNDPLVGGFSDREKQIREFVEVELKQSKVILDGFPRHRDQLSWLISVCAERQDKLCHVFMEVSREEALRRITLRNREDVGAFHEQFTGQALACRALHEAIDRAGDWHTHVFGPWEADRLARWILNESVKAAENA